MFRGHNPVNTDPRKNALLLAQLHTNYYHLLKFGHYPFIGGEVGVALLTQDFRSYGRTWANLYAPHFVLGA